MQNYEILCANRFRQERERLKLAQADIHRATGIAKQTLVAFESGASILYIRHKDALEALGFDLQYVYFDIGLSKQFDFDGFFDVTYQIILHMQKHDRGVDRGKAINILREVFSKDVQNVQSEKGKVASAFLKLVSS
jgi:DNA-binding XRE family transcriptional regulator